MKQLPDTFVKALAIHIDVSTPPAHDYPLADYSSWDWFTDTLTLLAVVAAGLAWLWW